MSKRIAVLLSLSWLAVIASGCLLPARAAEEAPLTASGTIRATELRIASEFGGRIQTIDVAVGDEVEAGQVLVQLDTTPWVLQLTPAEEAVEAAKAELAVVEAGPRPEEIAAARAAVELAEAQRDGAYRAWLNARDLITRPLEIDAQIAEARMQVALAAQGVELAKAQLNREEVMRNLRQEGTVERQAADLQVKAAQEALAAAQADAETAETLLEQLLYIRSNPLGYIAQANAAYGQYLVAQAGVTVAQAKLDDLLAGPTAEEIAVARAKAHQAEAQVNELQLKIARSTITSPITGVVMAQAAHVGELVAPAAPILTLADLSQVTLEVYVPENRIGYVSPGQTVRVTVDSYPGRVFEGRVVHVNNEPEFTPRNVATAEERLNTFYAVKIRLPNPDNLLKPGMPADAEFR